MLVERPQQGTHRTPTQRGKLVQKAQGKGATSKGLVPVAVVSQMLGMNSQPRFTAWGQGLGEAQGLGRAHGGCSSTVAPRRGPRQHNQPGMSSGHNSGCESLHVPADVVADAQAMPTTHDTLLGVAELWRGTPRRPSSYDPVNNCLRGRRPDSP